MTSYQLNQKEKKRGCLPRPCSRAKSTVVNDYWQDGGLSLLGTLAQYGGYLPNESIILLLEVSLTKLPPVAAQAANHHPDGQKYRRSAVFIDTK